MTTNKVTTTYTPLDSIDTIKISHAGLVRSIAFHLNGEEQPLDFSLSLNGHICPCKSIDGVIDLYDAICKAGRGLSVFEAVQMANIPVHHLKSIDFGRIDNIQVHFDEPLPRATDVYYTVCYYGVVDHSLTTGDSDIEIIAHTEILRPYSTIKLYGGIGGKVTQIKVDGCTSLFRVIVNGYPSLEWSDENGVFDAHKALQTDDELCRINKLDFALNFHRLDDICLNFNKDIAAPITITVTLVQTDSVQSVNLHQ